MGNNGKATLLKSNKVIPERFTPLVCKEEDVIIAGDWHIPLHDADLINELVYVAKKNRIKKLICGGDYWNLDSLSHYQPHQPEAGFEFEKEQGTEIANHLLKTFDQIDFIWGNHDHRFSKQMEFKVSFKMLMEFMFQDLGKTKLDKIRISDLDYMFLHTKNRVIRVCHPNSYSKIPLTVPRQLALKYGTSVIGMHSHHLAQGFALDGHNMIFEGGGLFDKHKTEYIQRTTTHHEWVPGFIMFKQSVPTLFSPLIGNL